MARYDSLRKLDRNRELCEYWESHQDDNLTELGARFGISRSRAWQLLVLYCPTYRAWQEKRSEAV